MRSYVTLIANADYVIGARALARSLVMVGSRWPLTILALPGVEGLDTPEFAACEIMEVEPLPLSDAFREQHSRQTQHAAAPFTKGEKPIFHDPLHNFVKLRLWELDQFEKIVFLDADTLVIRNIDRLFGFPEFCAAPNLYESLDDFHRMNSGVFVAQPSRHTFADMLSRLDSPGAFWRRTDQTFLQAYFPEWDGLPYIYNALQYVYFNLPQLWDWARIHVIHYQYEKPWDPANAKRDQLQPLIDVWRHVFAHGSLPANLTGPK